MCQFASFVVTKDNVFWCASNSHEDIISAHKLEALDGLRCDLVRIEIVPNPDARNNLSTWHYSVDQDRLPKWTFAGDPELERRAREALERRAAEEHWFAEVISSQAVVGYSGTATAGNRGTATAGEYGTATAGDCGTATAGYSGTATAGDCGTATAGNRGTATAGYSGTATAGNRGTATAGECGTATAGDGGILNLRWWDGDRYRIATFYVGEGGIEPNVKYGVDGRGKAVRR